MLSTARRPEPPSDDKRWKIIDSTMRRNGDEPHALIEALHTVQETFGYLDEEALRYVATCLCVPLSKVYGVATFYHFFTLKPQGKHTCVICTGTACHIKGADKLLRRVETDHGIAAGETTADGQLSVLTARCIGSCGVAPAVVLDGQVHGNESADGLASRLTGMVKG
jgi:bidirectional [NiFe] hydrogenase diaphorase subunit